MKKLLLFVVGIFGFMSIVNADIGDYNGKIISTTIEVGGNFEYEIEFTGPNYIKQTIYYDQELLEYNNFYINCSDPVECHDDGEVICDARKIKDGEILLQCEESEYFRYYVPALSFKAIKPGMASLQIGSEYEDNVNVVKAVSIVDESIDTVTCKEIEESSILDLLTEPFVIGLISGFSIVIVTLSVMLSKKNKQIKNTKVER